MIHFPYKLIVLKIVQWDIDLYFIYLNRMTIGLLRLYSSITLESQYMHFHWEPSLFMDCRVTQAYTPTITLFSLVSKKLRVVQDDQSWNINFPCPHHVMTPSCWQCLRFRGVWYCGCSVQVSLFHTRSDIFILVVP